MSTDGWGPDGFRNEGVTMDFRVGGAWEFSMVGPDGTHHPNRSVFKDTTPPSRLILDHGDGEQHLAKLETYLVNNP